MNTKIIKFDINKNLFDTLKAKQGDTKSRFLLFHLLDGAIPFNLSNRSVRAFAIKPDGKEVFNDLIVNDANLGYCTLELTNQMLAVAGTLKLEIMVIENDKKLTSNVFYMDVKESINSEKAIVSTNEFTALLNALASLSEYDNYKNEVKTGRGGHASLDARFKSNESSLETKVNMYADGYANVEYFRFLVNNIGTENEDYIPAINKCLTDYGTCYIPKDIKIGSPIKIKTKDKLKALNRNTTIKANNSFNGDCIIGIKTQNEIDFQIESLRVNGDMYNHSKSFKGIYINNENQGRDSHIKVDDVFIEEVPGDAFYLSGRGENFISNVVTRNNRGNGFYIYCADSWFTNLSSGINTLNGYDIQGANNRFMNCKAWFSNIGYRLRALSSRSEFIGCEAQDNIIGYSIASADNIITGAIIEATGLDTINVKYPYGYVADQPSIKFLPEAKNNYIQCIVTDRKDFIPAGTVDYIVDLDGTLNKVDCNFKQLRKEIVVDKSRLYSNILNVHGTDINNNIKYLYHNKQLNVFEDSNNTFSNIIKTPSIYSANCSINNGGYTVKNGICYVNIEIKALKDYSYANVMLNGFPKPLSDAPIGIYMDNKKSQINVNGELVVSSTITTNDVYKINGSYPIKTI